MNKKTNNPCATTFNDKYIFKFGGKIDDYLLNKFVERYDVVMNSWSIIEYKTERDNIMNSHITLLSSAACC
jgi:hypothetical protein